MEQQILERLNNIEKLTLLGAKKVLTMSDVAVLTGLSKSHLYKKCHLKEIPYWKSVGNKLTYFDKAEIEAWCLQHRVKPSYEIEQEAATYCVTGKKGVQNV